MQMFKPAVVGTDRFGLQLITFPEKALYAEWALAIMLLFSFFLLFFFFFLGFESWIKSNFQAEIFLDNLESRQ